VFLTSDYRYDGQSLNSHKPTVQASLYWWRPDNFYAGVWMSRVDFSDLGDPTTSFEVEVYGGRNLHVGRLELLRRLREIPTPIMVDGEIVILQDQSPLKFANVSLATGWSEGDFIEYLNEHVFFWPGKADGPIRYGARLLDPYEGKGPAVLRG